MTQSLTADEERELVSALRQALRGDVIDRDHPAYDEHRRVWNGLIDRRPAVIARCAGTEDVVAAVRVAREHRPVVSIRGGGHQVAGSAVCDDGLVIDLSRMKGVDVDPVTRTARAQAGVTWGELDRETQVHHLVTPGGEVSKTGIAGLTLGGGMGLVMRAFGLSCDNLRSIEIVTADGAVRTASPEENPDLFWAARGAGRGLGVVTSFEFGLHPLGPDVAVAQVLYAYEDAEDVLRRWRDVARNAPDTVAPEFGLWSLPADPEIPEELHGSRVVIVAGVYAGPPDEGWDVLAPLRELGTALDDQSCTMSYLDVQSAFDAIVPDGGRYYMKSHFMDEVSDAAVTTLLDHDARRPNPEPMIVLRSMGGAVARVGPSESAYAHRSAAFNLSVDELWFDESFDEAALEWGRTTWQAMLPYSNGGVYMNFAGTDSEAEDLRDSVLGSSAARLDGIRRTYDPDGVFASAARRP
jgi:FAD/FMN-containing dehydrogenase